MATGPEGARLVQGQAAAGGTKRGSPLTQAGQGSHRRGSAHARIPGDGSRRAALPPAVLWPILFPLLDVLS